MTKNMEGPRKVQPGMRSERLRKGEGAGERSWGEEQELDRGGQRMPWLWSYGMGYNTGALSTVRFVF